MTDRVGQRLGNYRFTRLLGRGGFAEVYLGEHMRLGTRAAVKVLYTRLATPDEVGRFEQEARTIAHLKHMHIVRILDYDVEDDIPFLVMDYAEGGTLRQRHARGTILPITTIVPYVKQVAAALQYAHDQRLIHRDVKPENMLVGERDTLLLSDFGIALVTQSSRYQSTQEMMGTMAYMAPEQIQGRPRTASDQYSLGIVVYEWLSGDHPFHGSMTEIVAQHLAIPPPPLRGRVPGISPGIEAVVMRALAKDLGQRFDSVQAFSDALEQASKQVYPGAATNATILRKPGQQPFVTATTTETLPASGASLPSRDIVTPAASMVPSNAAIRSSARGISRRAAILGLGIAGLAIAVGSFTWLASSRKPLLLSTPTQASPTPAQSSPSPTQMSTSPAQSSTSPTQAPASPPLGTVFFIYRGHSNGVFMVAWSPDGQRIASSSYDATVQVWNATTGGNAFIYRGHSATTEAVAWSPDGQRIASGSGDNTVQVWDATTGGNVLTYRGHSSDVGTVAWSPDGRRIVSGSGDHTAQVWDATTGSQVFSYQGHTAEVHAVAWSPDGRRIVSGSFDYTVQIWDATTGGDAFTFRGHSNAVFTAAWSPDGKRVASGGLDLTVQVWQAD